MIEATDLFSYSYFQCHDIEMKNPCVVIHLIWLIYYVVCVCVFVVFLFSFCLAHVSTEVDSDISQLARDMVFNATFINISVISWG